MSLKLIQKHLLHGTQEFELREDVIKVKISSPLKGVKQLDVVLAMLNPEPEIKGSRLHFHSRVKCGPLISMFMNKPNKEEFDAFVEAVKTSASKEYDAFAGLDK